MYRSPILHEGENYCIDHLDETFRQLTWREGEVNYTFSVRVRFSDHCYSTSDGIETAGPNSFICDKRSPPRVFCPTRYSCSKALPSIIQELFNKPTTTLRITPERNGLVFRLKLDEGLEETEKYYCFMRLKKSQYFAPKDTNQKLDLFIESAYPRTTSPASHKRTMFGRLAYETSKK